MLYQKCNTGETLVKRKWNFQAGLPSEISGSSHMAIVGGTELLSRGGLAQLLSEGVMQQSCLVGDWDSRGVFTCFRCCWCHISGRQSNRLLRPHQQTASSQHQQFPPDLDLLQSGPSCLSSGRCSILLCHFWRTYSSGLLPLSTPSEGLRGRWPGRPWRWGPLLECWLFPPDSGPGKKTPIASKICPNKSPLKTQ